MGRQWSGDQDDDGTPVSRDAKTARPSGQRRLAGDDPAAEPRPGRAALNTYTSVNGKTLTMGVQLTSGKLPAPTYQLVAARRN